MELIRRSLICSLKVQSCRPPMQIRTLRTTSYFILERLAPAPTYLNQKRHMDIPPRPPDVGSRAEKPATTRHRIGVMTLPNILTMTRIATAPAIGYFIWNGMYNPALACFAYAATTDFLDGFIARRLKQESDVGAILDPIADKLLLITSFVALYHVGLMPLWATKGYIARDLVLIIAGITIRYMSFRGQWTLQKFLDIKNYPTLGFNPTITSKCNTALQCLVVLTHLTTNHLAGMPVYDWSIFGLHIVTAITTCASFGQYLLRATQIDHMANMPRSKG